MDAADDIPAPEADAILVSRVLDGDAEAFHGLVDRHQAPLLAAIRGRLADPEAVREVFQDTWVRAFERLADLRDPGRLRAWLVSIALNRVRQRGRGRGVLSLDAGEPGAGDLPPDDAPAVSAGLERCEDLERLRAAVDALPPRQREVVRLRIQGELSHADVARVLGITEENARANLYQGLKRLRAELRDEDDEA